MSENPLKQVELYKSLEVLKEQSIKRLNNILYKSLTVENIESFADEAITDTVDLINDLLHEYQTNPNLEGDLSLNTQEQEDYVCKKLELPNISEILDSIQEVKAKIDKIKVSIQGSKEKTGAIITPPDQLENQGIVPGDNTFEKKKLIPRLLTLMYILETDFDINIRDTEQVQVLEGEVKDEMMRQTPYVRVVTPELNRAVYICDEEGNASYVFDTQKLQECQIPLDDLDIDGKQDKNSLIAMHSGIGVRVIQNPKWRRQLVNYLQEPLPEYIVSTETDDEPTEESQPKSEFEKREYLNFAEFKESVKSEYPGKGSVQIWYRSEYKKHKNWPSKPDAEYREYWVSWSDLVDKDNHLKRDFMPFDDFKEEVLATYPGEGGIRDWYKQEKKNHLNWPSEPGVQYKDAGWSGWSGVFGFEDNTKKKFLDFAEFFDEVGRLYPGEGSIKNWYEEEKEKHKNWPSEPKLTYKYKGWIGWSALAGKENPKEKEFLDFENFIVDVRNFYPNQGNVGEWYESEYKKHKNWPAAPNVIYKDSGWIGWPELVGKENMFKKEFIDFEIFSDEVRSLYVGGDVQRWYHSERKKHKNWPSSPREYYKDKGWIGWSALVGK